MQIRSKGQNKGQARKTKKATDLIDSFNPFKMAERVGFEPTVPCGTLDFESSTFDHSDTSPNAIFCAAAERILS